MRANKRKAIRLRGRIDCARTCGRYRRAGARGRKGRSGGIPVLDPDSSRRAFRKTERGAFGSPPILLHPITRLSPSHAHGASDHARLWFVLHCVLENDGAAGSLRNDLGGPGKGSASKRLTREYRVCTSIRVFIKCGLHQDSGAAAHAQLPRSAKASPAGITRRLLNASLHFPPKRVQFDPTEMKTKCN